MNLTLIVAITISVLVFFLTSIAVFITRKRSYRNAPVIVSAATHTAPGGCTITQIPADASTAYSTPYPTQGIPAHMTVAAGPTALHGFQQNATLSTTMNAATMNPPSYEAAVSAAFINEKQAFPGLH